MTYGKKVLLFLITDINIGKYEFDSCGNKANERLVDKSNNRRKLYFFYGKNPLLIVTAFGRVILFRKQCFLFYNLCTEVEGYTYHGHIQYVIQAPYCTMQ